MNRTPQNPEKENPMILLAELLKAVAHPKRLQLIQILNKKEFGKISVSGIAKKLKISQPETSRHLLKMKNTGIVKSKKEKVSTYYSLNKENEITKCLIDCIYQNNAD